MYLELHLIRKYSVFGHVAICWYFVKHYEFMREN